MSDALHDMHAVYMQLVKVYYRHV